MIQFFKLIQAFCES